MKAIAKPQDLFVGMNGTEKDYATLLEAQRRSGDIQAWLFEGLTLTLGRDCRYTPDFMVQTNDYGIEFHETKGFWRDDAKVKIRVAARMFPWFTFKAFRKKTKKEGGGWTVEEFNQ